MSKLYNISSFLNYKNNSLYINDICYNELIKKRQTPLVCISLDRVKDNLDILKREFDSLDIKYKIHYAIKASYFKPLLSLMKKEKIGVEVISENEWKMAILAGFLDKEIIFNGLGRSGLEIYESLQKGAIVNIDSLSELKKLEGLKKSIIGFKIGLRIHPSFKGDGNFVKKEGKLGMNYKEIIKSIDYAAKLGLIISGFSYHIFSNQTSILNFSRPLKELSRFINSIKKNKNIIKLEYIDIGGGIAPRMMFKEDEILQKFIKQIAVTFKNNYPDDVTLLMEPGRYMVSDATVILSKVKGVKETRVGSWAILDIGTNYLIPALGADFKVLVCKKNKSKEFKYTSFVDGICSPAGFIERAPIGVKEGDIVAVANCGAYTSVMKEEFVFNGPEHVFINKSKIVDKIKATSFDNFLKYHGWR